MSGSAVPGASSSSSDSASPSRRHWFEALADHVGAAYLRYSFTKGTEQEAIAQYGPQIVDRVNLAHGRVKPAVSLDASIGADLRKSERFTLRLEGDVQNISDRLNVIDFAGLFSGNAVGPPRSANVRLTAEF